jgi:mannose-6-phosphate isomerase-like protein (cupin superfamily)
VHQVPLDELVGAPPTGDPRIHPRPVTRQGMTYLLLSPRPGGPQAFKQVIPAGVRAGEPDLRTHEGYDWVCVLSGRLRLVLGDREVLLEAGEAAEFDTRTPHWFGNPGPEPVEILGLFGPQGERMHVRARPAERR